MATDRIVERRRVFKQYKEDVKERGKPFYPYAMFHDTIMSLVVVLVIIGLAVVWKYTTPGNHIGTDVGLAREALRRARRPGHDQLRPAARLVLLLPLLPAPDLQVAGVGVPRHDRHPDDLPRAPARAPVHRHARRAAARCAGRSRWSPSILVVISMGVLTYKGATAKEALGSELVAHVPTWAEKQGFDEQPDGDRGREALRRSPAA